MIAFYGALGCNLLGVDEWRAGRAPGFAVQFGPSKINIHPPARWQDPEFTLRAHTALPGSADLCLVWDGTANALTERLADAGVSVELGPVPRVGGADGGTREGTSTYVRDPDGNLVEFIIY